MKSINSRTQINIFSDLSVPVPVRRECCGDDPPTPGQDDGLVRINLGVEPWRDLAELGVNVHIVGGDRNQGIIRK